MANANKKAEKRFYNSYSDLMLPTYCARRPHTAGVKGVSNECDLDLFNAKPFRKSLLQKNKKHTHKKQT